MCETTDHLLLARVFSREVWFRVLQQLGLSALAGDSLVSCGKRLGDQQQSLLEQLSVGKGAIGFDH